MKVPKSRLLKLCVLMLILVLSFKVTLMLRDYTEEHGEIELNIINKDEIKKSRAQRYIDAEWKSIETASTTITNLTSNSICPDLTLSKIRHYETFQGVAGSTSFVYAAHLDGEQVTITALVRRPRFSTKSLHYYCQLWHQVDQSGDSLALVKAEVEYIAEDHGRRYTAAFIKCPLRDAPLNGSAVIAVNVVAGDRCRQSPASSLPIVVSHPPKAKQPQSEFTVCVSPLNLKYGRAYQMVEMVELNKILGADKIVFYNNSIALNVNQVLQMYQKLGDVEVHQWPVPVHVDTWPPSEHQSEVWYYGQLAAINDCLVRHRYRARYLVFTDMDEFIIPMKDATWHELFNRMLSSRPESKKRKGISPDVYLFRCTFFRQEWPRPVSNTSLAIAASKYRSALLEYTLREVSILSAGSRSKMIVNPKRVPQVGIHFVSENVAPDVNSEPVSPSLAVMHHYRSWERPDQKVELTTSEQAASRFGPHLVTKLAEVWARLPGVPLNIDKNAPEQSLPIHGKERLSF